MLFFYYASEMMLFDRSLYFIGIMPEYKLLIFFLNNLVIKHQIYNIHYLFSCTFFFASNMFCFVYEKVFSCYCCSENLNLDKGHICAI